jgi:hypothetical protein
MLRPWSEALRLHLERARDSEGGSKTAWCADYWQGECRGRGWWWRVSKESKTPQCHPECMKIAKNRRFRALFSLKIAKNPVFLSKVLNKIYSPDVF